MKTIVFVGGAQMQASFTQANILIGTLLDRESAKTIFWDDLAFSNDAINAELAELIAQDEPWRAVVIGDLSEESLESYALAELLQKETSFEDGCAPGEFTARARLERFNVLKEDLSDDGLSVMDTCRAEFEAMGVEDFVPASVSQHFTENPFDIAKNMHLARYTSDKQHPMIKLLQLLCGLPSHVLDKNCVGVDRSKVAPVEKSVAMLENYSESRPSGYNIEDLVLLRNRPSSVVAITPRKVPSNISQSVIDGDIHQLGDIPTEFYLRNHYPDKVRFTMFDIGEVDVKRIGEDCMSKDELRFWLSVCMMVLNKDLVREMQAYQVYRLGVDLDVECYLNTIVSKWALAKSASTFLNSEIDRLEDSLIPGVGESKEIPDYNVVVGIENIELDPEKVSLDARRYGWLKDSRKPYPTHSEVEERGSVYLHPIDRTRNTAYAWKSVGHRMGKMPPMDENQFADDEARLNRGMVETLRRPRRAVAVAAETFRNYPRFDDDTLSGFRLNKYDTMDLSEDLQAHEESIASTYMLSPLNSDAYKKAQERLAEEARATMKPRAYLRDLLFISLVVLLATMAASVPFILGMAGGSGWNPLALALSAGIALVLVLVGIVPVKLSHRRTKKAVKAFSANLKMLLDESRDHARALAERMGRFATYRKGYSLLNCQGFDTKPYTHELQRLHRSRADLEDVLMYFGNGFGDSMKERAQNSSVGFRSWAEAEAALETPGFFDLFPDEPFEQCPLNAQYGASSSALRPYRFVTGMTLRRVPLYDPCIDPVDDALCDIPVDIDPGEGGVA